MSTFKDHFSGHAEHYAAARPHYPAALFDWLLAGRCEKDAAWDAGCGNGQAAVALAGRLGRVIATDPSARQIAHASRHPRVEYRVEAAEACSLDDASVSLVSVAQALHWFDHDRFFGQVRRVLRPGGLLAAWTYGTCSISEGVDDVLEQLYRRRLGPWWPPERALVESGYREIVLPFEPVPDMPAFHIELEWTLPQLLHYLESWSASQRCLRETGVDAVAEFAVAFGASWGDPATTRRVRWPIALRACRRPMP